MALDSRDSRLTHARVPCYQRHVAGGRSDRFVCLLRLVLCPKVLIDRRVLSRSCQSSAWGNSIRPRHEEVDVGGAALTGQVRKVGPPLGPADPSVFGLVEQVPADLFGETREARGLSDYSARTDDFPSPSQRR